MFDLFHLSQFPTGTLFSSLGFLFFHLSFLFFASSTSAILAATSSSLQNFGVQRSNALHMRQYAIASRVYRSSKSSSRVSFSASLSCLYGFLNFAMAALSSSESFASSCYVGELIATDSEILFHCSVEFWFLFQTTLNFCYCKSQESSDKFRAEILSSFALKKFR